MVQVESPPPALAEALLHRAAPGHDLDGNTYWEFRLTRGADDGAASHPERWRRIVNYPRSTHLSDVTVGPLWHQWLRHTRPDAPSLAEQQGDVLRQERVKYLAAQADARWEAKPRVMEDPGQAAKRRALPAGQQETDRAVKQEDKPAVEDAEKNDPWAKAKAQGPGENWQPTAWSPTAAKKR
ncbi:Uncharacterized protein TPAR_05708 [Tolypocladium paradoxum]|uniref:Uncharacterized protein n=1 Tax=Tolypocladium paradoxum TaxID=94208 RepID=A0A2S4KV34_9HYPO|nr:Uncharacterized protein TPAR_05708 [Tolypocladium paradoxum]